MQRKLTKRSRQPAIHNRRGQALIEFAMIALVLYLLVAGILTFGHALYVAQGLQTSADLAAREIARTPLPADESFETLLANGQLAGIYDDDFLVYDLDDLGTQDFFVDIVPNWPVVNQQLATMMIVDRPDFDGDGTPDENLIRYPGALLTDASTPTGYTVGIPLITARNADGVETVRWVPVVEEIDTEASPADDSGASPDPFRISSAQRGMVAVRINYPFQSASMSSFRPNAAGPFEPTIGSPNAADDLSVVELNPGDRPGDGFTDPVLSDGETLAGTYGGRFGLGAQGALGSNSLTGGRPVRPFRRLISAQAIFRREIFE